MENTNKIKSLLKIDCPKITRVITDYLRNKSKMEKKTRVILGLSGGIDSAVSAHLCKLAGLDLYVCLLPYKPQSWWKDEPNQGKNTELIIKALKIPQNRIISMDISSFVDPLFKNLEAVFNKNKIRFNEPFILTTLQSRERLNLLNFLAEYLDGLVVGTGNISEALLHYRTNFGHLSGDVQPVGNLFKTQIFDMAKYLKIPEKYLQETVPSAELHKGRSGKIFPIKYREADPIMYLYLCKYPEKEVVKEFGFNGKIVRLIFKRVRHKLWLREGEWGYCKFEFFKVSDAFDAREKNLLISNLYKKER